VLPTEVVSDARCQLVARVLNLEDIAGFMVVARNAAITVAPSVRKAVAPVLLMVVGSDAVSMDALRSFSTKDSVSATEATVDVSTCIAMIAPWPTIIVNNTVVLLFVYRSAVTSVLFVVECVPSTRLKHRVKR